MYDFVSGQQIVKHSYFVSKSKALEEFPHLKSDRLCGAIVYYDGENNVIMYIVKMGLYFQLKVMNKL